MSLFDILEDRMQGIFESGNIMSPLPFKKLAKEAVKQMKRNTVKMDGKVFTPSLYTIMVNPADDEVIAPLYQQVTDELVDFIAHEIQNCGYQLMTNILVRFIAVPSIKRGNMEVMAEVVTNEIYTQVRTEESAYIENHARSAAGVTPVRPAQQRNQNYAPRQAPNYGGQPQMNQAQGGRQYQNAAGMPYQNAAGMPYQNAAGMQGSGQYPAAANMQGSGQYPAAANMQNSAPYPVQGGMPYQNAAGMQGSGQYPAQGSAPYAAQGSGQYPAAANMQFSNMRQLNDDASFAQSSAPMAIPVPAPEPQQAESPSMPISIDGTCELVDTSSGRTWHITAASTVIGRDASMAELVLEDTNVSRQHAELRRKDNGWFIADLGSTNGTRVNGLRVTESDLSDGDTLTLGLITLQFREL